MKKYLFGLVAITLALGTVSFTTKFATKSFRFIGSSTSSTSVAEPNNWEETTSLSCPSDLVNPCVILNVTDNYYHVEGGRDILNNAADKPAGESVIAITTQQASGGSTFYVTSASSFSVDNKN